MLWLLKNQNLISHNLLTENDQKFAGPLAQRRERSRARFGVLGPIAMTIRIRGALGLEHCPVNRFQATLGIHQIHSCCIGFICVFGWHQSTCLGLGFKVLLFSVEPIRARPTLACQQGLRVLMFYEQCYFKTIETCCFKQRLEVGAPAMR